MATGWTAARIPDQTGRTAIVTGANSGLGLVTAQQLARHGAYVIMAVRDEAKGRRAAAGLPATAGQWEVRRLDLADLESVRAFAAQVHRDGLDVDLLVNNAGLMFPPRQLSRQGHELQFAVNHLGHFALTGLLLDRLGDDARVVTVTSSLHRAGRIRFDDLTGARGYSPVGFYAQSKLANVLFALELHRRLRAAGGAVRSLLAHPGYTATNLQTSAPTGVLRALGRIGNGLLGQDADMGALPQLYAAVHPDAESGQFVGPDRFFETRGHPTLVSPAPAGADRDTARRLWEVSERLTGVEFDLPTPG